MNATMVLDPVEEFLRGVSDEALHQVNPDANALFNLMKQRDKLRLHFAEGIRNLGKNNQFADEQVPSDHRYAADYKPKDITEQIKKIRNRFPEVGFVHQEEPLQRPLPATAEGWFATLRWQARSSTYANAVQSVFDQIKITRNGIFHNGLYDKIDDRHLREGEQKTEIFKAISEGQRDSDILVVPYHLGLPFRGFSPVRSIALMHSDTQCALGVFETALVLLIHARRLSHDKDLGIYCSGDEVSVVGNGQFDSTPFFCFDQGKIRFGAAPKHRAHSRFGTASAFLIK